MAGEVTKLLNAVGAIPAGGPDAAFERIYAELKGIASGLLREETDRGLLQTTVLVHEALLRLRQFEPERQPWESRAHFYGSVARAMRRVLIDEARRRKAHSRAIVFVEPIRADASAAPLATSIDLLDLDEALRALHEEDAMLSEIITLKIFADLSAGAIGEMVGMSEDQVRRRMTLARAWLLRWLIARGRLPSGSP